MLPVGPSRCYEYGCGIRTRISPRTTVYTKSQRVGKEYRQQHEKQVNPQAELDALRYGNPAFPPHQLSGLADLFTHRVDIEGEIQVPRPRVVAEHDANQASGGVEDRAAGVAWGHVGGDAE